MQPQRPNGQQPSRPSNRQHLQKRKPSVGQAKIEAKHEFQLRTSNRVRYFLDREKAKTKTSSDPRNYHDFSPAQYEAHQMKQNDRNALSQTFV